MREDGIFGFGAGVAVFSALCCITPVVAMFAGISGIAATFSWVEPLRPYLIGLTVALLGFAWFQKLRPQADVDCVCDDERGFFRGRSFLGLVTIFAVLMMTFPLYSEVFYSGRIKAVGGSNGSSLPALAKDNRYEKVVFAVGGMTCDNCERHVESVVSDLKGVTGIKASYKDSKAVVTYDKSQTNIDQIRRKIDSTGYKAGSAENGE